MIENLIAENWTGVIVFLCIVILGSIATAYKIFTADKDDE